MTQPPPNPFGGNPFGPPQAGPIPAGLAPAHRDEVNTLATLSVVFAFVFAPVGAVLGHLSLSQIGRTRQPGRDRALVGLTLSYVFFTTTVVALVVWAALGHNDTGAQVAAPSPTVTAGPPSTSAATTTTPPPPTVAPAELAALLPSGDDDKRLTGNPNLTQRDTKNDIDPDVGAVDNDNCWSGLQLLSTHHYDLPAITGVAAAQSKDVSDPGVHPYYVQQAVAAFHDAGAAQRQLGVLTDKWRQCGGATVLNTQSTGKQITYVFTHPVAELNGVTTIECSQRYPVVPDPPLRIARAIAAKNNVVIDVAVAFREVDSRQHDVALAVANFILDKISGPR